MWTERELRVTEWGLDHPDGLVPIRGVGEDGGRVPVESTGAHLSRRGSRRGGVQEASHASAGPDPSP